MTLSICFFLCYHFYIAEALYSQIKIWQGVSPHEKEGLQNRWLGSTADCSREGFIGPL